MIDLHLHTTASDGRLSPADLVHRARRAGVTVMSVTDHDTVAGLAEARAAAEGNGMQFVDGIEITAVHAQRDVHVLGYFFDPGNAALEAFLAEQRDLRVERLREIARRLEALGVPLEIEQVLLDKIRRPGGSVGRPMIANALMTAGHVRSIQEAFDRYLASGRAAFVPRAGRPPADVVEIIRRAGGLASLAHPGVTNKPELVEPLTAAGLDALEVYHSDHTPELQREWLDRAEQLGLLVTGGSDFHGDDGDRELAGCTLPAAAFARLTAATQRGR